jgi:hypothetical protein
VIAINTFRKIIKYVCFKYYFVVDVTLQNSNCNYAAFIHINIDRKHDKTGRSNRSSLVNPLQECYIMFKQETKHLNTNTTVHQMSYDTLRILIYGLKHNMWWRTVSMTTLTRLLSRGFRYLVAQIVCKKTMVESMFEVNTYRTHTIRRAHHPSID